jgi:ubiquinone/menaquinone biosynthesis C-methylase UbiE
LIKPQVDYNSYASVYERCVAPALSPLADLLLEQINFSGGGNILDLCSGTGLVLGKLIERFPSASMFVGTDLFDGMLHLFRHNKPGHPRVLLAAMDAERLGLASRSFSLVTLQCGLQYLDPERALREIYGALVAPGGIAAIQGLVNNEEAFSPPHRRLTKMFMFLLEKYSTKSPSDELAESRARFAEQLSEMSKSETGAFDKSGHPELLCDLARSIGFSNVECRSFVYSMQFQDAESFLQRMLYCTPSSNYYLMEFNGMGSEAQTHLHRALEINANKHCRNDAGFIEESYIIFRLLART